MIALYHRASRGDEDPAADLERLRSWSSTVGHDADEFLDRVEQPKERWPAMEELARSITEGEVEGVVTGSLHELFRGPRHLRTLGRQMIARGVWLVTLDGAVDTRWNTGDGDSTFSRVVSTLEVLEAGRQSERIRAGMVAAKKRGRQIGGSRYRVVVNPEEIRILFEEGKNGRFLSYREILQELAESGSKISRGKLLHEIDTMRHAGMLDDAKREHHRRQSGRRGGRKRSRVSYDPDEIRMLIALGFGAHRIMKNAQGLPRSVRDGNRLGLVRRIVREVKESESPPGTPARERAHPKAGEGGGGC